MEKMNFEVDSALLSELGERLVGSVQVALMELVKNAYDADATEVGISIESNKDGTVTTIDDNGSGMTLEQVRKYWMRIATTNKAQHNISERYGRPRSGAKGIGRFSCRRLGSMLDLTTVGVLDNGTYQTTRFSVNWKDFRPGTVLGLMQIECETVISDEGKTGTKLVIRSTDPKLFTQQNLRYIKRNSVVLVANRGVSRDGYERDPGFNMFFCFPGETEKQFSNLRELLIDGGWGTVNAFVDSDGHAQFELEAIDGIHEHMDSLKTFKHLKGVKLKIGVFPDKTDQIRNREILTLGVLRNILEEWGGVYVRYNGVRVEPYGSGADDWLDIDKDRGLRHLVSYKDDIVELSKRVQNINPKRYLITLLSSHSYVGDVYIASGMDGFDIKASREGLLNTGAFDELRDFTRIAIDYITIYRDKFIRDKEDSLVEQTTVAFIEKINELEDNAEPADAFGNDATQDSGKQAIEFIRHWSPSIAESVVDSKQKRVVEGFTKAADLLDIQRKRFDSEKARLRLVASTSVLLSLFSHDVKAYLSSMNEIELELDEIKDSEPRLSRRIDGIQSIITTHRESLMRLVNMTLSIATPSRDEEEIRLSFKPHLELVKKCFDKILMDYCIECSFEKVPNLIYTSKMKASELYSILINVFSNAIKAVIAKHGTRNGRIAISARQEALGCVIICRDNGIGVNVENSHKLFNSFVVDPERILYSCLNGKINREHSYVLGNGSGLGLSIVKQIVLSHGGDVRFVEPDNGWSTQLQIQL